jgi:hypothetical protein
VAQVRVYNATVTPKRGIGRPLGATDAQIAKVRTLAASKTSVRGIASATGLGVRTVRTILDKIHKRDRTTRHEHALKRQVLDKLRHAEWRAQKRAIEAMPKRITDVQERGAELLKASKGL